MIYDKLTKFPTFTKHASSKIHKNSETESSEYNLVESVCKSIVWHCVGTWMVYMWLCHFYFKKKKKKV